MPAKNKKFYISTALPYVNYSPHAGWALEIIQTDVIARYHRLLGENVFFLTGTDENSIKNVQAAREEEISTKELVDRNAKKFYDLKKALNLSFDDFIRTTEKRHIKGAQKLWLACKNDIYKKPYRGLYCIECEEFYKEKELVNGFCPEHKVKPEPIEEENYFFRLSKYQDKLKKIITKDQVKIIPETRKNEVLSFINSGLEDICISRLAERAYGWGIPVPDDPTQIAWCWFDALSNYINALGYAENSKKFQERWQRNNNKLHVIGKGILRFHALYWCAFLLSAKLSLPKKIFVHGYLTVAGQKMSKSLGNVIDPFELVKKYGTDSVRYFLLREIPPTEDGDFTYEKFEQRYNADLASGLGNLVARVLTMAERIPYELRIKPNYEFKNRVNKIWKNYYKVLDEFRFNEALVFIWELISFCDRYIEQKRPWELIKNQKPKAKNPKLQIILSNLLFTLANIARMLQPFLPGTSEKIFKQLGIKSTDKKWTPLEIQKFLTGQEFKIKKEKPLFPRLGK